MDFKNTYYSGSDTHRYIDDLFRSRGEILIISPYIDRYYAEILLRKSGGRKFYVMSSSLDGDALKILGRKSSALSLAGYALLSLVILGLLLLVHAGSQYLISSVIPIAVGIVKNAGKGSKVILKVPKQFVHAKMYISDDMAIIGSANLTYKGTFKNVEHVNVVYDQEEIKRLKEQSGRAICATSPGNPPPDPTSITLTPLGRERAKWRESSKWGERSVSFLETRLIRRFQRSSSAA